MNHTKTLIIAILLLTPVLSWDWDTHRWSAEQICNDFECNQCEEYVINGSIAPDKEFKDFINHHSYNKSWECQEGNWTCPDFDDFVALEKAEQWLNNKTEGCSYYYNIGVAAHYYMDSKVFWHRTQKENYEACHRPFETKVGDKINKEDFTVTQCNITVTKADLLDHVRDFEIQLDLKFNTDKFEEPTIEIDLDDETIQYILAFMIILTLLIIFKR